MIDFVADTSVVVKWFYPEDDYEKAEFLLKDIRSKKARLVLPASSPLELLNVLYLSKKFSVEMTIQSINSFFDLEPELVAIDKILALSSVNLAYEQYLPSYDAAFISLATQRNIPLFTADYKHHKKEISKNIVWLSEWKGKL